MSNDLAVASHCTRFCVELAENKLEQAQKMQFLDSLLCSRVNASNYERSEMTIATAAATAANAARFQHRRQGQYLPRNDSLSAQQQSLLAGVPHWKQEYVYTNAAKRKASENGGEVRGIKIRKWVVSGAEKASGNKEEMDAAIKLVQHDAEEEAAAALVGANPSPNKGGEKSGTATPSDQTPLATVDSTPIVSPAATPSLSTTKSQHPLANSFSVDDLSAPLSSPQS